MPVPSQAGQRTAPVRGFTSRGDGCGVTDLPLPDPLQALQTLIPLQKGQVSRGPAIGSAVADCALGAASHALPVVAASREKAKVFPAVDPGSLPVFADLASAPKGTHVSCTCHVCSVEVKLRRVLKKTGLHLGPNNLPVYW